MLVDHYRRVIDYLRISVTDRCNLRCIYCMPDEGIEFLPHCEILSYEEIIRVVSIGARLGIRKVRITGGEPLVRRDLERLISGLSRIEGLEDISMTTNGLLLAEKAHELRRCGLKRVNISLDSLDPEKYRSITRGGDLGKVWAGVEAALEVGLCPVKINVVAMDSQEPEEVVAFGDLAFHWPLEVRFIERMPLGASSRGASGGFLSAETVLGILSSRFHLVEETSRGGNGPATSYRIKGGKGSIGIIAPMTRHFCQDCNRLRLTPDGKLKPCLFSPDEIDLRGILRGGATDEQVAQTLLHAIRQKPKRGAPGIPEDKREKKCVRPMNRIGG